MVDQTNHMGAGGTSSRRLYVYSGGFLRQKRVRRILALAGYDISLGLPRQTDLVGVWGQSPTAHRGQAIAQKYGANLVHIEDAFLRSLHPGRTGAPPMGLVVDHSGLHFDPSKPSKLEQILTTHALDDTALLNRARVAIERIKEAHLCKYSAVQTNIAPPPPGYVLVIDQTQGDASLSASGATRAQFLEMLVFAQEEHPGRPLIIKSHPETQAGFRAGYFRSEDENERITILRDNISPWLLFDGAVGVYTISSQMGFEAIFAGHKPRVFGKPFYGGWGLTADENPVPRRERKLTKAQLFAAAMILYPIWYDPYRDRLCDLENVLDTLEAQARAWRADHAGWIASGVRLWKRKTFQSMFGSCKPVVFQDDPDKARGLGQSTGRTRMVWASKDAPDDKDVVRVEDGFLRSRGLGAELVPPLSLVTDDVGIYYDPAHPSRLEHLITARADLRPDQRQRAQALIKSITKAGLSKYNLQGALPEIPKGHKILVPGQVEDDASVRDGTETIKTNLALLTAARNAYPDAVIIYKPHPDVEAGLRPGKIDAMGLADVIATKANPIALLGHVDQVWTMTSLLGFEALLRGVPVTTLGAPFYAGWGLTEDLGTIPLRRRVDVSLEGLVYACLIDYPRYFDPVTKTACPVEIIVDRLASARPPRLGASNRMLSKLQGIFASRAQYWRG
jgi:capsular polysaccharide export protein